MPIYADPEVARAAGFERPISHGLNTFGLACRGILKCLAPRAPERLRSMSARFVAPALPGDTIRVEIYGNGERVRFRALARERNILVLDRGTADSPDRLRRVRLRALVAALGEHSEQVFLHLA